MKKTSVLLLLAFGSLHCAASPLTPELALDRALRSTGSIIRSKTVATANKTSFDFIGNHGSLYVFNRSDNEGFIITPSDSNMPPMLACIESGSFDPNNIPEAMQWILSQYELTATASTGKSTPAIPDYYLDWERIEPLVKAKWNQDTPYNDRCPIIYGERSVTGCVATAMAQIIYTHRYAKGSGSISYTLYTDNSRQTFNFETAKFDFDVMTDTYNGTTGTPACEAVAELMEACGKSVKMSYSPYGSEAVPIDIANALVRYFGYDSHTQYCDRSDYQTTQWETIIYNELCAGRPVLYSGSTENAASHAFVCDGYEGNGLFHINWGWGGMSDGYFSLMALSPGQIGIGAQEGGFNCIQSITLIVPPGAENLPDTKVIQPDGDVDIIISDIEMSALNAGSDLRVTFTAINKGGRDFMTNSSRLMLYTPGGSVPVAYGNEIRSYNVAAYDSRRATFTMTLVDDKGNNIPAGNYELRICDTSGTPLCDDAVMSVSVTDNGQTKDEGFQHFGRITVGNATKAIPPIIVKGTPLKLKPSVRNDDDKNYVEIGFALFMPGTDKPIWSSTQKIRIINTNGVYISGFPYLNEYNFDDVTAGVYDAAFITTDNKIISERRTVKLAEKVNGTELVCAPDIDAKSASVVPGGNYKGNIVIPTEVTFTDGRTIPVTAIEAETFAGNSDVTGLDIPASVDSIGLHAFRFMSGVETIRFRGGNVPFPHVAFIGYRMNPRVKITVPSSAINAYTEALSPYVPESDEQGSINNVANDTSSHQTLNRLFDLQGREVKNPQRGHIYITSDGRKHIVK